MGHVVQAVEEISTFFNESKRFFNRCEKPTPSDVKKVAMATGVGFLLMGFIGFAVKLVHIPINSMLLGA